MTRLCRRYGCGVDPLDLNQGDIVRHPKTGEIRYVASMVGKTILWRSLEPRRGGLAQWVTSTKWSEWAGEELELIEPAPWYWRWDWVFRLRERLRR